MGDGNTGNDGNTWNDGNTGNDGTECWEWEWWDRVMRKLGMMGQSDGDTGNDGTEWWEHWEWWDRVMGTLGMMASLGMMGQRMTWRGTVGSGMTVVWDL